MIDDPDPVGEQALDRFWKRLRAEKKFSGPDELRVQITKDIVSANRFFTLLRKFRILMLSD